MLLLNLLKKSLLISFLYFNILKWSFTKGIWCRYSLLLICTFLILGKFLYYVNTHFCNQFVPALKNTAKCLLAANLRAFSCNKFPVIGMPAECFDWNHIFKTLINSENLLSCRHVHLEELGSSLLNKSFMLKIVLRVDYGIPVQWKVFLFWFWLVSAIWIIWGVFSTEKVVRVRLILLSFMIICQI